MGDRYEPVPLTRGESVVMVAGGGLVRASSLWKPGRLTLTTHRLVLQPARPRDLPSLLLWGLPRDAPDATGVVVGWLAAGDGRPELSDCHRIRAVVPGRPPSVGAPPVILVRVAGGGVRTIGVTAAPLGDRRRARRAVVLDRAGRFAARDDLLAAIESCLGGAAESQTGC